MALKEHQRNGNLYILRLNTLGHKKEWQTTETYPVGNYTMRHDALEVVMSEFEIQDNFGDVKEGDLVLFKYELLIPETGTYPQEQIPFIGFVESVGANVLTASSHLEFFNFVFPAMYVSGQSFESYIAPYIMFHRHERIYQRDSHVGITHTTDTPHRYQPDEKAHETNMISYLVNAFKKYNIVSQPHFDGETLTFNLARIDDRVVLSDKHTGILNWDVVETPRAKVNKFVIYDLHRRQQINNPLTGGTVPMPRIRSTYILQADNEIRKNMASQVDIGGTIREDAIVIKDEDAWSGTQDDAKLIRSDGGSSLSLTFGSRILKDKDKESFDSEIIQVKAFYQGENVAQGQTPRGLGQTRMDRPYAMTDGDESDEAKTTRVYHSRGLNDRNIVIVPLREKVPYLTSVEIVMEHDKTKTHKYISYASYGDYKDVDAKSTPYAYEDRNRMIEEYEDGLAEEALKGNLYGHNIECDIEMNSRLIDVQRLQVGTRATVFYKGKEYESVITGIERNSRERFVHLQLGHTRYTLEDLI